MFLALEKSLNSSPKKLLLSLKCRACLISTTSAESHSLSQVFQSAFSIVDVVGTDASRKRNTNVIFATICHWSEKLSK